jgi:hypothetical protein
MMKGLNIGDCSTAVAIRGLSPIAHLQREACYSGGFRGSEEVDQPRTHDCRSTFQAAANMRSARGILAPFEALSYPPPAMRMGRKATVAVRLRILFSCKVSKL